MPKKGAKSGEKLSSQICVKVSDPQNDFLIEHAELIKGERQDVIRIAIDYLKLTIGSQDPRILFLNSIKEG